MANSVLTPTDVTREALRVLHQKLRFVGSINRSYDDRYAKKGAKIGNDLKIRLPNQYTVTNGATLNAQETAEESVTLTVSTQKHVGMNFTSEELTMDLDDFSKRIIQPAMSVLAASVEADALTMRKDVYNQANNTANDITFSNVLEGKRLLQEFLTPEDDNITCLLRTKDNWKLVDALKGLFNSGAEVGKQYRSGVMGHAAGMDFMQTSHLNTHDRDAANTAYTTDTRTSALPLVETAVTSITTASGSGATTIGDVFTIANVFRVHPETKENTGELQQFITTNAETGTGTWEISPSIILAGAKQNVIIPSTSATAAITLAGTLSVDYGQSMIYHRDAFAFATADLVMPKGVDFAARENFDGLSLRIVKQYDINNDAFPCRVDILYGKKTVRPQMACRLANVA